MDSFNMRKLPQSSMESLELPFSIHKPIYATLLHIPSKLVSMRIKTGFQEGDNHVSNSSGIPASYWPESEFPHSNKGHATLSFPRFGNSRLPTSEWIFQELSLRSN